MKFVFAFLAIYLLSTSFAAQTKVQLATASQAATREAVAALKRISSTKLGKTLIDTLQIELKASTGTDPRPRILQLLNEIQQETNDQISGYNDAIAVVREDCTTTQSQLNQEIANLQQQIADQTLEQGQVQTSISTANDQLTAHNALSDSLQSQLADSTKTRQAQQTLFNSQLQRLKRIINILEQTRGTIVDRIEQDNNPSFIQKNNVLVEIRRKVMTSEFQAASAGWGKFLNFLTTKALAKIKETTSDSTFDGLQKIVNVINDVIDRINHQINELNAAEIAAEAAFATSSDALQDQITTNNAAIAALKLDLANNQDRLNVLVNLLETNNASLQRAQDSLETKEDYCEHQEDQYTEDFARSTQESEIIQEVIDIVQSQLTNLRSAIESAITSS